MVFHGSSAETQQLGFSAWSVISLIGMAYETIQIPVELDSVYFVNCPKQGLEMDATVLHRVAFLEYSCPKQGQDFKPLAAPLYPNMDLRYRSRTCSSAFPCLPLGRNRFLGLQSLLELLQ